MPDVFTEDASAHRANAASGFRRWRRHLFGFLFFYSMTLALIFAGCADRLILFPTTDRLDVSYPIQSRHIQSAGTTLEIWTSRSPIALEQGNEPRAYILSFIGNADRAEHTAPFFARDWAHRPVEVWAVNYPGYGASPGPCRLASIGPSALAAYDALRQHAGDKPILVQARSIGTAAALHVAANRPVAGCILHNPPPLRQLIVGRFGWWNLWLLAGPIALTIPPDLDSLASAQRISAPAIFLLAGQDEVVPPKYQQRVVNAYAGQKRLIDLPTALHNDHVTGRSQSEYQSALDWLWTTVMNSPHLQ